MPHTSLLVADETIVVVIGSTQGCGVAISDDLGEPMARRTRATRTGGDARRPARTRRAAVGLSHIRKSEAQGGSFGRMKAPVFEGAVKPQAVFHNKKPPRGGPVFLSYFNVLRLGCGGWI